MDETQCRTCLGAAIDSRLSIDRRVNGWLITEMIEKLTQVSVSKDDIFSNLLCKRCFNNVCSAFSFRTKFLDTERTLRGFKKKLLALQNIKKEEEVVAPYVHERISKMEYEEIELDNEEPEPNSTQEEDISIKQQSMVEDETENMIAYEIEDPDVDEDDEAVQYLDYEQVEYLEMDTTTTADEQESPANVKLIFPPNFCSTCAKTFNTELGFKKHVFSVHQKGSNPFLCEVCNIVFPFKDHENEETANLNVQNHMALHAEGKNHSCHLCFSVFKTLKQLETHQTTKHNKSASLMIRCKGCNVHFLSAAELNQHIMESPCKDVQDKHFRCYICNKIFNMGIAKKKHIQEEHHDKAGTDCPLCLRCRIPSAVAFENHYKTHFIAPRFNCNFCERAFYESDRLQMHIKRAHDSTRYICFFCSKDFRDKSGIARHILGVHFNDRKYKCGVCSKAFTTSYNLKEHMFALHKKAGFVYSCEKCCQEYLYRKQFERHRNECVGVPEKRKR